MQAFGYLFDRCPHLRHDLLSRHSQRKQHVKRCRLRKMPGTHKVCTDLLAALLVSRKFRVPCKRVCGSHFGGVVRIVRFLFRGIVSIPRYYSVVTGILTIESSLPVLSVRPLNLNYVLLTCHSICIKIQTEWRWLIQKVRTNHYMNDTNWWLDPATGIG